MYIFSCIPYVLPCPVRLRHVVPYEPAVPVTLISRVFTDSEPRARRNMYHEYHPETHHGELENGKGHGNLLLKGLRRGSYYLFIYY